MNIGVEGRAISGSVAADNSSAANTAGDQRSPLMISSASARPALGLHGVMPMPCWASIKLNRSNVRERALYPIERVRTAQTRPIRELIGAAHVGTRLTFSAASPAIMVAYLRLSGRGNVFAVWWPSRRQSNSAHLHQDIDPNISERTSISP